MVITSVKPQRNGKRVNIYLDDKFGFGLDLENFVKLGLKIGQELEEESLKQIIKKGEFQKTLDKLLRFATLRPRSEKEIKNWFRRKKIHESIHLDLFNRLKRLDLIDDKAFAVWWIDQRNSFKPKGKRALISELRQKGINKEILNSVLNDFNIDEKKVAEDLILENSYKWQRFDQKTAAKKKAEFLTRKGFSWDVIAKIVLRTELVE